MSLVEDIRAIRGVLERIELAVCGPVEVPVLELVDGWAGADVDSPIELVPVEDAPVEDERVEPSRYGLYRDKVGDLWQKCSRGWTFTGYADGSPPIVVGHLPHAFANYQRFGPFTYVGGERNELEAVSNPVLYSLSEVVTILHSEGIETGQRRLKQYLNTGVAWTDGFNNPRECAADYLVVVKKASPERDAVVRVTESGVAKLVELMGAAA